ncbi:MAG: hypothetical protein QMD12_02870 [Candidatus Aenigmarchaeota archaeon]|nr:hypothetical protein [Candidatus Aenigmarchaeota archaeon]
MSFKYFLFHGSAHLLFIALIYFVFKLSWLGLLLVFFSATIIDADHLPFIKRKGIKNWIRVWRSHIPKSYPLHNFLTILIFFIASFLIFNKESFILGICSLSAALHLIWDFVEDVFIFKIGIKHWKV